MQWGGELHSLRSTAEYKYETLLEKKLIKKIEEFPEVVEAATNDLAPHQIANYLKECAADLHGYYNDTKFLVENNSEKKW